MDKISLISDDGPPTRFNQLRRRHDEHFHHLSSPTNDKEDEEIRVSAFAFFSRRRNLSTFCESLLLLSTTMETIPENLPPLSSPAKTRSYHLKSKGFILGTQGFEISLILLLSRSETIFDILVLPSVF